MAAGFLLVRLLVVELRRIAKAQDLAVGVTIEQAIGPLRFERNNRYFPWPRAIGRRHAPARQTFKRFELEDRCRRLDVIQRPRRNYHTAPPVARTRCNPRSEE